MKILAIDTSTNILSLAIADEKGILIKFHEENTMKHASSLIPTIDKLLGKIKIKLKDISAIAISIGPGSFTGLRIGVATVKGINMALGIPIVAVPTLDVIAYNFIGEDTDLLCPVIDAKKNMVYSCIYHKRLSKLHRLSGDMLISTEYLLKKIKKECILFGNAVLLYEDELRKNKFVKISKDDWHPKAETLARIGLMEAKKKRFVNPDKLVPLYLHSQYCQIKGRKK